MPELPEVETVVRGLASILPGRSITRVRVLDSKAVLPLTPRVFARRLAGARFVSVTRRGKYLHFVLDRLQLVSHLRMTGKFVVAPQDPASSHVRLVFRLDDGMELFYHDPRRFGTHHLYQPEMVPAELDRLGPEPLDKKLRPGQLATAAVRRTVAVKQLLLDQHFLAGLGNIYVCEALFAAKIHPERPAASLATAEWATLLAALRTILRRAIRCNGTTISDFRAVDEKSGTFQNFLQVYGHGGEPCRRCGTAVVRIVQGGRGSWFCPVCQPR